MTLDRWSPGRLALAVGAWLLLSPILLFGVTRVLGEALDIGVLRLLILGSLWIGPPAWLVLRWRRSAQRKR